jgi:hypothetical protein
VPPSKPGRRNLLLRTNQPEIDDREGTALPRHFRLRTSSTISKYTPKLLEYRAIHGLVGTPDGWHAFSPGCEPGELLRAGGPDKPARTTGPVRVIPRYEGPLPSRSAHRIAPLATSARQRATERSLQSRDDIERQSTAGRPARGALAHSLNALGRPFARESLVTTKLCAVGYSSSSSAQRPERAA